MTYLPMGQKPMVMTHYPHMLHEDVAVWTKFLQKMQTAIQAVWYDVHVGKPVQVGPEASTIQKKVAAGVTRKRIDVVCSIQHEFWVIEVKPHANMTALGQAFSYTRLFIMEYNTYKPVRGVVVCDSFDEDMAVAFEELGVLVFVNE